MVICLERDADFHIAQLMLLPLTVSCFSKIQIGFTFLVLAHLGSPRKGLLNGCVCVCLRVCVARRFGGHISSSQQVGGYYTAQPPNVFFCILGINLQPFDCLMTRDG